MKNTPNKSIEASYFKAPKAGMPDTAWKASPRTGPATKKRHGKRVDPEVFEEREASTEAGAFQIYLNLIGATPLLSREQEWALGNRIRAGFADLLQHLLPSGRVGDLLLRQAQAELNRADCAPARRSALGASLTKAANVLQTAREQFVPGSVETANLHTEMAAAMGKLVAVLEIWPDQCLELLEQVELEYSDLLYKGHSATGTHSQSEFVRRNLMDAETCGTFLAGAMRLRTAAVAARNEMVAANLRLVVAIAKRMKQSYLPLEDLVQEGNRGLLLAAERFDERLGNRFSTFATRLIKSAMRRENDNQGRTIRLPVHRCEALRKLEDARAQIESELHQAASVEQLSEKTGFSCGEVRELTVLKQGTVSLEQETGDDGEQKLGDFLSDPASLTPFYGENEAAGSLDPYLKHLADTQRAIVAYVYGLGGCPQLSLKEAAEQLGLDQSEARRLHQTALKTLRTAIPSHSGLHGYACAA